MGARPYGTLAERFAVKVDRTPGQGPNGDCWEWRGGLVSGYGQIRRPKAEGDDRTDYAHRVAYELANGVDLGRARETDLLVLHRCDNRCCVNPAHLFLGSDKVNNDDMRNKGRWRSGPQAGEANPAHKLKEHEVRAIRAAKGSLARIARKFGISRSWAWAIRNGEAWSHLSDLENDTP